MREEFLACYREVFNDDGSRKLCGREKCKELIRIAEKFPSAQKGQFGSVTTGFANDKELFKLYVRLYTD